MQLSKVIQLQAINQSMINQINLQKLILAIIKAIYLMHQFKTKQQMELLILTLPQIIRTMIPIQQINLLIKDLTVVLQLKIQMIPTNQTTVLKISKLKDSHQNLLKMLQIIRRIQIANNKVISHRNKQTTHQPTKQMIRHRMTNKTIRIVVPTKMGQKIMKLKANKLIQMGLRQTKQPHRQTSPLAIPRMSRNKLNKTHQPIQTISKMPKRYKMELHTLIATNLSLQAVFNQRKV